MIQKCSKLGINIEFIRVLKLAENKYYMDIFNKIKDLNNKLKISLPGELGCLYSHLICILDANNKNYNSISIIEDDIFFIKNLDDKIIYNKSYFENFNLIYLGSSQWSWFVTDPNHKNYYYHTKDYYYANRTCGTFGLYIKKNLYSKLLNLYTKYNYKVDIVIWYLYSGNPCLWNTESLKT